MIFVVGTGQTIPIVRISRGTSPTLIATGFPVAFSMLMSHPRQVT